MAISYGVYESRGMAMGGAATAIGNYAQAPFYNPALLAFHDKEEEEGRDGRVYLPIIVAQVSEATEAAFDAIDDELDTQLSSAINAFNALPTSANMGVVAGSATELRDALDDIANQDLTLDGFIGFNISEPSNREGGAFYFGTRLIGGGVANVSDTDRALLDDYIDSMNQLASGVDPEIVRAEFPHLINSRGQLIDPTATLTSNADISALAISEWGMAMAKQFEWRDQAISIGITPKLMRVDAFRDTANFNDNLESVEDGTDEFSDTRKTHVTLNADIGVAAIINEHYRVSLTLKDAFEKSFTTTQEPDPVTGEPQPDLKVRLSSRSRLGLGYVNEKFTIGLDYDLGEAKPMASEAATQELSIGAEYLLLDTLALRAGYRNDQTGLRDNLVSGGIGYRWKRFVADVAYVTGGDYRGGGLQLGWTF
ncbi:MAG: conjugal transfer protein TraF [Cellvibrio sp.]|uniref:conjugal transfer protein TraF n=1 Tax=Cellvibrio sp. TaxID=1965322 RepID=UPI0031AE072C